MANMHQNPLKIRLPVRRQGVKEATYPRSDWSRARVPATRLSRLEAAGSDQRHSGV